jgi:hypothetical protein
MERSYLIRYGLMGQVGRFDADPGSAYGRGQAVVVRSHRGTEIGEVLIETQPRPPAEVPSTATTRVLRPAGVEDFHRARAAEGRRDERFATCERIFRDGVWPIELIDVEPLLDDGRTVLHYLGPHRLDTDGVLAAFRAACDLDVMLQPVGRDLPDEDEETDDPTDDADADAHACGSCGAEGGGGGCGTSSAGGCGTSSGAGGCGDCGVKKLLSSRR